MIILNAEADNYADSARVILQNLGELREGKLDRAGLLMAVAEANVLIVRLANQIDDEILANAPRLRVIVSATTGLNHIDVEAARRRGIEVLSLQGEAEFLAGISATAEHSWALLLALLRQLPRACQDVAAGRWDRDSCRGHELSGKTLGIVGMGRLGRKVAAYGDAFGMTVAAYDPVVGDYPQFVRRHLSLHDLLAQCDVVSLHVPLNAQTVHLVGRSEIALMPSSSVLINTSRGEVVDEAALLEALASGSIAGAAVDVIEHEIDHMAGARPSPLVEWARDHHNLIVTPHIGGATYESMEKTEVFMALKLSRWLAEATKTDAIATGEVA